MGGGYSYGYCPMVARETSWMDVRGGVETCGLGIWGIRRTECNTDGIEMAGDRSTALVFGGTRAHGTCFCHPFPGYHRSSVWPERTFLDLEHDTLPTCRPSQSSLDAQSTRFWVHAPLQRYNLGRINCTTATLPRSTRPWTKSPSGPTAVSTR